jgi:HEAT repeat protein
MIALKRIGLVVAVAMAASIGNVAHSQQPSIASEPVTYQDVLKLLRSGESEQKILDTLAKSTVDVNFVLGASQVEELRKMRVSDEFVESLKKLKNQPGIPGGDVTDFALILDCSGSMLEKTKDGTSKMDAAKKTVTDLIQKIPNGMRLTFVIYGHDSRLECNAVKVVTSKTELNDATKASLTKLIADLKPAGHTPIALALQAVGKELANSPGLVEVALITDGVETCHGDPAKEAAELAATLKLKSGVNVIGFGVGPEERKAIEKIALAGRGKYYDAKTAAELQRGLTTVAKVALQAVVAPPEEKVPDNLSPIQQALVEDLSDKSGKVRRAAAESLGKLGEKAKATAPALVLRVKDDVGHRNSFDYNGDTDGCCKAAALDALKKVAPEKVTTALFGAHMSKNVLVRNWSSEELTRLVTEPDKQPAGVELKEGELAALLKELTDDLKENDLKERRGSIRRTAAECLGSLSAKAADATSALVERVADDVGYANSFDYNGDNNGCCKAAALDALKKVAPDKVQEALLKARKSKNDLVRAWATERLADVDDGDTQQRGKAARSRR